MKRMRIGIVGALWAMLILGGCGGGGGSTANVTTPGKNAVAASISTSVPAAICPTGGIAINTGIDSNGNGVLDAAEITNTQYVCNGAAAANALMSVTDEPAGANCAAGGKKISVGLDTDNNGTLDPAEVTSSNYICNGTSGANGLNTLVSTTGEAPGANCVYGGLKVNSGLDSNGNGTLDAAEITNTSYACNVSAGSGGFSWVEVTASSVQAASNMGYMTNSASQVVVTLPAAPAIGDVVKVSGSGAGGWRVAANAGQKIRSGYLMGSTSPEANIPSIANYNSVAVSADGNKLVASTAYNSLGNSSGEIFTSTDSGASWTWQRNAPQGINMSLASSADGNKLVAAPFAGDVNITVGAQISTSSDGGATWTLQANSPVMYWTSVVSSDDGSQLAAVSGTKLYFSADGGVNWSLRNTFAKGVKVAMSSDGSKLVATEYGGQISTSSDSGLTWVLQANSPVASWWHVASSADGSKLVAAEYLYGSAGGYLYTSGDGGVTWVKNTTLGVKTWSSVTISADGSRLAANPQMSGNSASIWISTDGGTSWLQRGMPIVNYTYPNWQKLVFSADGNRLINLSSLDAFVGDVTFVMSGGVLQPILNWRFRESVPLLEGGIYTAIELQYMGNNTYMLLSSAGGIYLY